ncbi:hypothetical protein [uncultured Sphingomonas sp.]|uniref:hypothetical protein n=1 Tax=uncultured Sphingomonas sp. TaxID=158754 RepID=UPI0025D1DD1F|nr:hypothetical protein [uncultured Sphingomonas sp.]
MRLAPSLLPPRRRPSALSWLIAATTLLALLAGAFLFGLDAARRELGAATANRLFVQVIDPNRITREETAKGVLALLRGNRVVEQVRQVDQGEVARLVDPYIAPMPAADLPLPALIEATLLPTARAEVIARDLRRLPHVEAVTAAAEVQPLVRLVAALRSTALGVLLVTAAATALVAALATRGALAAEMGTLSILHQLGATDRQLAEVVLDRIGRDAATGALAGLLLSIVAVSLLGQRLAALGIGGFGILGWLGLAILTLAMVALTLATAAATMAIRFRHMP